MAVSAQNPQLRGPLQEVLDSERFNLLRTLEFFNNFGDVALWEVVHRAKWQRFPVGHALFNKGEEGRTFHIIAQGELEVFREGLKVAVLGAGALDERTDAQVLRTNALDRRERMAQTLGTDAEGFPDGFGAGGFASVVGKAQTGCATWRQYLGRKPELFQVTGSKVFCLA